MEPQHQAVLTTVTHLVDPVSMEQRDRKELISACRTLADWLRQYVVVAAEQSAEIQRLTAASLAAQESLTHKPSTHEPLSQESSTQKAPPQKVSAPKVATLDPSNRSSSNRHDEAAVRPGCP